MLLLLAEPSSWTTCSKATVWGAPASAFGRAGGSQAERAKRIKARDEAWRIAMTSGTGGCEKKLTEKGIRKRARKGRGNRDRSPSRGIRVSDRGARFS